MDHCRRAGPLEGEPRQLPVEEIRPELLQVARAGATLLELRQVVVGGNELEDVNAVIGEVAIPQRGSAPGDDRHPARIDPVPAQLTPHERDPVLELVPDLAAERAEHKGSPGASGSAQCALREPRGRLDDGLAPRGGGELTGGPARNRRTN